MFDLSFTQDPEWIAQRTKVWKTIESSVREGISKRDAQRWEEYFFTGVIPKGFRISPGSALELFPAFTLEGIQCCLQHNLPDPLKDDQFKEIQRVFGLLELVPGLPFTDQLYWFEYVFGKTYDPERKFPFLIGKETEQRKMTLSPNWLFEGGMSTRWLKGADDREYFLAHNLQFIFSLIPFVDPVIFRKGEIDSIGQQVSDASNSKTIQAKLIRALQYSCNYPDPFNGGPGGEYRKRFLKEFRERMDKLEHYPGDLKQIWEEIKAEHS